MLRCYALTHKDTQIHMHVFLVQYLATKPVPIAPFPPIPTAKTRLSTLVIMFASLYGVTLYAILGSNQTLAH